MKETIYHYTVPTLRMALYYSHDPYRGLKTLLETVDVGWIRVSALYLLENPEALRQTYKRLYSPEYSGGNTWLVQKRLANISPST